MGFRHLCAITLGLLCLPIVEARPWREPQPSTAPSTRPITALLVGTYRGTVVDDGETVPCITHFTAYRNRVEGTYIVRAGEQAYQGTLRDFALVNPEQMICRFRWHDKHGKGLLTVRVTSDGESFAGSWGLEVVQDELVWKGKRAHPTTRPGSR